MYPKLKRNKKPTKIGYLTARVYDSKFASILVKVPIMMDVIPEVPEIIAMDKWVGILMSTNPLSYRAATFSRAKAV